MTTSSVVTNDTISNLQLGTALLQSLSQPSTYVADMGDFPTNLQQTVQDQVTLTTNPNLAQEVSQQVQSPLLESQTEAVQALSSGNELTPSDPSLTSLETSMQTLQDITNAGLLANNPSLTQQLMKNYNAVLTDPTSLGSLVDTSV